MYNGLITNQYQYLRGESDYWRSMHEQYPGNDLYWEFYQKAELEAGEFAYTHEEHIEWNTISQM